MFYFTLKARVNDFTPSKYKNHWPIFPKDKLLKASPRLRLSSLTPKSAGIADVGILKAISRATKLAAHGGDRKSEKYSNQAG